MANKPREPTARQVRLGRVLKSLRVDGEHGSQDSIAASLGWSESKLSRIESAKVGVTDDDLKQLLDLYGMADDADQSAYIWQLKRGGSQSGWESKVRRAVSPAYADYIGYEDYAVEASSVETVLIPGLLQTRDYTATILDQHLPDLSKKEREDRLAIRERRRAVFSRTDPLIFWGVVSESVLRHAICPHEVMADQLDYVLTLCQEHPHNINLLVLPESAASHAALFGGSFVILSFPERWEPDIVYVEGLTSTQFIEDSPEVRAYEQLFRRLMADALRGTESLEVVQKYRDIYSKG
ncbi:DUF5753 domain-containing protein [Streptomyces sp. NPDC004610]|uniref:DUF5753 domain-containing protein n=1 Tax=unclassified Streptomyces TaxID=2593676 RepID=UPI0033A42812